MKQWWRNVRPHLVSGLVYAIARFIGMTMRIEVIGLKEVEALPGGKILAGWHGRTLMAANVFKGRGYWTIISQSRDGEMQSRIFRKFGFMTIRGSTGRGGVKAAIESIKVLREGGTMAFTPDGPRGPSGVVQSGIMLMARKSGAALVPCGVSAKRRWLAGSWDRYMVPWPFTRGVMIFGEPMYVPNDATEDEVETVRLALERELHRLEAEAESRMGHASVSAAIPAAK